MTTVALLLTALGALWLALACLTAVGSTRRGTSYLVAAVAGLAFPVTWVAWYVRDEGPV